VRLTLFNRPPRQEERARRRNCGFVSFYKRADAQDAKDHLHDTELDGMRMVIGCVSLIACLIDDDELVS
jgi:RNA recognition motif-containing protein